MKIYRSKSVVLENQIDEAGILVDNGKISKILTKDDLLNYDFKSTEVIDFGNLVIMPGVVDSHVHVNEPGRTEWEGFMTATKAAAKGGITTIVDMPLNSIPPTTTLENFHKKIECAKDKVFVDVAFWGGVIPDNEEQLLNLVNAGVVGFKCFLCPSGVEEFPCVNRNQVESALKVLEGTGALLAFHAEIEDKATTKQESGEPSKYETFLQSRPSSMEVQAIKMVTELCQKYNARCHIVHLSAADALPIITDYKTRKNNLTVETCHHYLKFSSDQIPDGCTQFKCCPPIRNAKNRELLWDAVKSRIIDLIVSDHSPCTPDLKLLKTNENQPANFLKAWGGISSVQFGLSLFWSEARKRGLNLQDVVHFLCFKPAQLCRLQDRKGLIKEGLDADLVVWNPDETFLITEMNIEHKNKITPYLGMKLYGKVYQTIVHGQIVYNELSGFSSEPCGKLIFVKH